MGTEIMKKCTRCKRWLPQSEFYHNANRKSSSDGYQSCCKVCMHKYVRDWKRKKREEARSA